jgi:hypothetical protein
MTITLQALSLVEKVGPVQVHFTLHLRDRWRKWMQDGCKVLHEFMHGIKWTTFYFQLDYFQNLPLGDRPNTNPGDHGTPNAHIYFFWFYFTMCGGPA